MKTIMEVVDVGCIIGLPWRGMGNVYLKWGDVGHLLV